MAFKVLVAEDEEITLNNIIDTLREEGYEVSGTQDGQDALMKMEAGSFDVLITDIKMPGMSGLDLLSKVKEQVPGDRSDYHYRVREHRLRCGGDEERRL